MRISPRMSLTSRSRVLWPLTLASALALGACGGAPPPAAPASTAPAVETKERAPDTSAVAEPPGLIALGRVKRPDALVSAAASFAELPLPNGAELVRSIAEDGLEDVVDLSQPLDAAVTLGLSRSGVDPLFAFSIGVPSFDAAKAKLGARHKLSPAGNGALKVEGLGKEPPRAGEDDDEDDDGEEGMGCVLAHAPKGARLVCGDAAAVDALAPYMSRTLPRQTFASDVHVEVRPEPVRAPLAELRATLPVLARSMLGSQSAAVRDLIDASLGEIVDVVTDTQALTIDADVTDAGVELRTRVAFQSNGSTLSRLLTGAGVDAAPAAFWHLPADADTAVFGRGVDPKLLDRPRELVTNLLVEAADEAEMPAAERRILRDLVADRTLTLIGGDAVYAKGFDPVALEAALAKWPSGEGGDELARQEAKRGVVEQVTGWHLYRLSEPIAKTGPLLKDWSALWNRPAFTKWARAHADGRPLPRMRVAPPPAGVALPKDTVHLEITIPRDPIEVAPPTAPAKGKAQAAKMVTPKPFVFHVFAVPDGGATWLALGLDAKLVGQKVAASLSSAPATGALGSATIDGALRAPKLSAGGFYTLRGFAVMAALGARHGATTLAQLEALPRKGATPIVFTSTAEGPSEAARGGVASGTLHLPRAAIHDIVKYVMMSP